MNWQLSFKMTEKLAVTFLTATAFPFNRRCVFQANGGFQEREQVLIRMKKLI
jgi:hypothetical protein